MISVRLESGKLQVFSDFSYKNSLSDIPGGTWSKKSKCWEYPTTSVLDIAHTFKGDMRITKEVKKLIDEEMKRESKLTDIITGKLIDPHPFLMGHQRKCRKIAEYFPKFAYFCDTGTGKTLISLQIISDKADKAKFLVVAPKSTIKDAWLPDQRKFFPKLRLLPISRNVSKDDLIEIYNDWFGTKPEGSISRKKDKLMEHMAMIADVVVINPESFKLDIDFINSLGIDGLIFDESALLRNSQSAITKAVTKFAESCEYTYLLSGEPDPNGRLEYFSQMKIIDPAILGNSFTAYRNKYFDPEGYMGYTWAPKASAKDAVAKRIARRSIVIRKDECLDLPQEVYQTRTVELSPNAMKHYYSMLTEQMVFLDEDRGIAAPTKSSVINKLRQIASGFVYDTHNDKEVVHLHKDKLNLLNEVLEEIGNKQVIIWGTYQPEIEAIEEMLKSQGKTVVTAYGKTKDIDQSIVDFKTGKAQYIVAHPQSIKYGITLVNCNYAVYFSLSENYDDYKQSRDRILRKGQTKSCTIIFLLAENTIDRHILNSVRNTGTDADIITGLISDYTKRGR